MLHLHQAPGEDPGVPTVPLTLRQVVSCYLQQMAGQYDPASQAERTRVLELFLAVHGDKAVSLCRAADLVFFISDHPEWKSGWTRTRVNRTIQTPFNWAERLGLIARNPFKGVSQPSGDRGRPIEPREFQAVLRATDACFRRVLIALRYSGMRPGELRKLEWMMIDPIRGVAVLAKHKTAKTRRDRAPRVIVLHPVVLKLLAWIKRHQAEGQTFVFLNSHRRPWVGASLNLRLWELRKKLNLPPDCKLYGCRHAFGTQAALNGVDLPTLAQLMGHTNTQMTMRYVHLAGKTDHLKAAAVKALKGIGGS